jgi:hypothetical protein
MHSPAIAMTFVVALTVGAGSMPASAASPAGPPTDDSVQALALQWFGEMQSGQIDRAQLTPDYSAQLTDDVVKKTAQYLKDHAYGSEPIGTQILLTRTIGEQKFYVVKIIFPRGDAASLMLGFDTAGKITGVSLMSMAGD